MIEPAPSGRAKCRACGRAVAKGELRFGESVQNQYGEGEAHLWFHVLCGACARPESLQTVLAAAVSVPDREWIESACAFGIEHPRVTRIARAERASSGRATCRSCRELIEKGAWRIALHLLDEGGRMNPIGTIHAACAFPYFGTVDILDRLQKLTPDLGEAELAELAPIVRESTAKTPPADEESPESPGLAKTQPDDAEADALRKTGV